MNDARGQAMRNSAFMVSAKAEQNKEFLAVLQPVSGGKKNIYMFFSAYNIY